MKIDILTLFPDAFNYFNCSLLDKARKSSKLEINIINIRDFAKNKHQQCDDYSFGGGPGMVMMPQPIADALKSIDGYKDALKIYMSPKGKQLKQDMVKELSNVKHMIILCGHYEGVDQRVLDLYFDEEISVGDYVLMGGEVPAMVLVDAVSRYIDNVLGNADSVVDESFSNGLLEYPQYTRPQVFEGVSVPDVLVSGNHQEIAKWRHEKQIEITKKNRPDLLK